MIPPSPLPHLFPSASASSSSVNLAATTRDEIVMAEDGGGDSRNRLVDQRSDASTWELLMVQVSHVIDWNGGNNITNNKQGTY
jgi:hypothetical protein